MKLQIYQSKPTTTPKCQEQQHKTDPFHQPPQKHLQKQQQRELFHPNTHPIFLFHDINDLLTSFLQIRFLQI